jgi:protein-tyrosine-phosphatase
MEKLHFELIEELCPEKRDEIELLGKYVSADQAEDDIPDPFGKSSYHYRLAQSQITLAVRTLADKLQSCSKSSSS